MKNNTKMLQILGTHQADDFTYFSLIIMSLQKKAQYFPILNFNVCWYLLICEPLHFVACLLQHYEAIYPKLKWHKLLKNREILYRYKFFSLKMKSFSQKSRPKYSLNEKNQFQRYFLREGKIFKINVVKLIYLISLAYLAGNLFCSSL